MKFLQSRVYNYITSTICAVSAANGASGGVYEAMGQSLLIQSFPPEAISPGVSSAWASSVFLSTFKTCSDSDFDISPVDVFAQAQAVSCAGPLALGIGAATALAGTGEVYTDIETSLEMGPFSFLGNVQYSALGSATASASTTISGAGSVQFLIRYTASYARAEEILGRTFFSDAHETTIVPKNITHQLTILRIGDQTHLFGMSLLSGIPTNTPLGPTPDDVYEDTQLVINISNPSGPLVCTSWSISEPQLDFDNDGRLSCLDADLIDMSITSPPSSFPDQMDLDNDGLVTESDANLLGALIDGGFASGLAGDIDRSCTVDCTDIQRMNAMVGTAIGTIDYRLPADIDLDGDIDLVDRTSLLNLVGSPCIIADVDGSGCVDFSDMTAILSAWGACSLCPEVTDSSGDVDFGDMTNVLSHWPMGCE